MPKRQGAGRPRIHPIASESPCFAARFIDKHGVFKRIRWRHGTKGALSGDFAIVRVCPADGAETKDGVHLPGSPAWLVCERFSNRDRKFYLAKLTASASRKSVVAAIKARSACEQAYQQMKEELGLEPFRGRFWFGLHRHAAMTRIAFAFLQHLR